MAWIVQRFQIEVISRSMMQLRQHSDGLCLQPDAEEPELLGFGSCGAKNFWSVEPTADEAILLRYADSNLCLTSYAPATVMLNECDKGDSQQQFRFADEFSHVSAAHLSQQLYYCLLHHR